MQTFLTKTFWLFLERASSNVFSFASVLIVTRWLTPAEYGSFAYMLSLIAIFSIFGQLGLDGVLFKKIHDYPEQEGIYMGTTFCLKLVVYLVSTLLLLAYVNFIDNLTSKEATILKLGSIVLLMQACIGVLIPWFRAKELLKDASLIRVFSSGIGSFGKIFSAIFLQNLVLVALSHIAISVIEGVLLVIVFVKRNVSTSVKWVWSTEIGITLLKQGGFFFLGSVAIILCFNIDIILIRQILGRESAGVYSIVPQLFQGFQIIPFAITTAAFPIINSYSKNYDQKLLVEYLESIFLCLFIIAIAITIILFSYSEAVIKLLFDDRYASAASVLRIVSLCTVLAFFKQLMLKVFIVNELGREFFTIELLSVALNVALNLVLIPNYGISGAAIATVTSLFFSSVVGLLMFKKTRWIFFTSITGALGYRTIKRVFLRIAPK